MWLPTPNIPSIPHCLSRVRGSFPSLGGLKETKMFLPHPLVKLSIVGSLRDREVACSASDLQGLIFECCVWRAVSSHLSHHPQEVLLAQFSLYVHKSGLKPDSVHFLAQYVIHVEIRIFRMKKKERGDRDISMCISHNAFVVMSTIIHMLICNVPHSTMLCSLPQCTMQCIT